MSIASRTRECPICSGAREINGEPCFECRGSGTIILPESPYDRRRSVSAQDQALARIREMRSALDALEGMVRQIGTIPGARTSLELSRTIAGRARSLESTVIAAAREQRQKDVGSL